MFVYRIRAVLSRRVLVNIREPKNRIESDSKHKYSQQQEILYLNSPKITIFDSDQSLPLKKVCSICTKYIEHKNERRFRDNIKVTI